MIVRVTLIALILSLTSSTIVSAQNWESDYSNHYERGKVEADNENYEEASKLFKKAYTIAVSNNDTSKAFEAGYQFCLYLYWSSEYRAIIEFSSELEQLYSQSVPGDLYAKVMDRVAYSYYLLGDPYSSFNTAQLVIDRIDSVLYPIEYADALQFGGARLVSLSDYEKSLEYKNRALDIFEEYNSDSRFDAYLSIYVTYLYMGDIDTGFPFLLRTCDFAEINVNSLLLFDCYYYLGDYYSRKNDFSKAIINYEKSARVAEEINRLSYLLRPYKELGQLYKRIDEIETALVYFNRMYTLSKEGQLKDDEMRALMNIGISYRLLGEYEESEPLLFEAYEYYQTSARYLERAEVTLTIADLYIELNKQEEALAFIDEVYSLGVDKQLDRIQLWALNRYLKLDDSFFSRQQKLKISKDVYRFASSFNESTNLSGLRTLANAYGDVYPDSALFYAEQALEAIERLRLTVSDGQLKIGTFSGYASFYNEIGSWYASHKNDYSRAYELFEAAKSRTLVDQLAEAQTEGLNEISEELEIQVMQLQKRIDQLYREKETALLNEIPRINSAIADAELAYQVAFENIRRENPALESFEYPEPVSLEETQELLDSKTAVIEYALLEDGLAVIYISKKDVVYKQIDYGEGFGDYLSSLVNNFRSAVIELESLVVLEQRSVPLYDLLFLPVEEYLSDMENLVIVPDGSISLIPVDALLRNGEFLGKQFLVKTLPSITAFGLIQPPNRSDSNSLLAVAGSGFNSGDNVTGSSIQRGYAALPFTLIEVDSLASKFENPRVLKNQAVSEASIKNLALDDFKYIHFATHGDINELSPTQSGLILSKKDDMESLFGEDGLLNAQEITRLSINADMVVLSACNTANGKVISGEGLLGLQRSFLIAGASSVVSSLWSIYDRSTPVFMNAFYENLKESREEQFSWFDNVLLWAGMYEYDLIDYKSIALHQTKLEMMDHPYYNHPVHWASFVITGK
ncbi:MAG: CHAT domain-containing protein [Balneolales bacterium]|nr:CHAT domain-containing protein [Balneolales bacterium]